MMKYLLVLLASAVLVACNPIEPPECPECPECPDCPPPEECPECPECPEPPPCPEVVCPEGTTPVEEDGVITCTDLGQSCGDLQGNHCDQSGECPDGYSSLGVTWDCNPCCLKDEVESPPTDCSIYFTLSNVGTPPNGEDCDSATNMMRELCFIRHYELIYPGFRNLKYGEDYCSDKVPLLGISNAALSAAVDTGDALIKEIDRKYLPRMAEENSRCPGRSVVQKEVYRDFKNVRLANHMDTAYHMHGLTQETECRQEKEFDNLQGWCCKCFGRGPNCQQWVQ